MFEYSIDDFFHNMENESISEYDDFTEEELVLHIESLKAMQCELLKGKNVYQFDQEWLM